MCPFWCVKICKHKNGDSVVVTGTPRYYVKGGKLNFNATKILPYGQGLLFKQFLELKQKLEFEGLFATEHKKPIPKNVKTIGVVTSEGGAVIQDIINVSTRRNPQINIVLYPVKVQGNKAENEIVKGIEFFSEYPGVDVVIVARGGGSIEDLQPYNTEIVARATYACQNQSFQRWGMKQISQSLILCLTCVHRHHRRQLNLFAKTKWLKLNF